VLACVVLLGLALLVHEFLSPYGSFGRAVSISLKLVLFGLIAWFALLYRPNPLTQKKLQRFRSIKRGYWSLLLLVFLLLLTVFGRVFVNHRALVVSYEGRLYFPTYTAFHPGTDFGLDYDYETNYRDLRDALKAEDEGNWVLMPIVPWNEFENDFLADSRPPHPPTLERRHFLGTDKTGRDVLARLFYGFRIAMICSLVVMVATYAIGIAIGCAQGYFGGKFDMFSQRLVEIWANMPFLYIVIITVSFIPAWLDVPFRIALLLAIMIIFGWTGMTYYMRSITYKEKERDYTASARLLGASTPRILFNHILPNAVSVIVTFIPFSIAGTIASLTALDFLGFGLPTPTPSWGELLKQGTGNLHSPWIIISAFGGIVSVLMLVTFVGEAIREAFDPKKFTIYQ